MSFTAWGAASVRGVVPNAIQIFLMPPDQEALRRRLLRRNADNAMKSLAELRSQLLPDR